MAIKFGSILHLNNSASEATLDANNLKGSALQIDEFNSASLATIGAGLSTAPGKRRLGTIVATTGSTAIPTAYYVYLQTSSGDVNLSGSEWTTLSNWDQIQLSSYGLLSSSYQIESDISGSWQGQNFVSASQTFLSTGQRSGDSAITGSLTLSGSGDIYLNVKGNITSSGELSVDSIVDNGVGNLFSINTSGLATFDALTVNGTVQLKGTNNSYGDGASDKHTFTGNITASNDISASGDIFGSTFVVDNEGVLALNSDQIYIGSNAYRSIQRGSTHEYASPITASTSISASGDLFASLSLDTTNLNTVMYNTTTGQFFHTGSYGGGGGSGDTLDLHFSASEGNGFSLTNAATASFTSGSGEGLTVTAGSTNNIEFELVGVLSSSAQIASDISGSWQGQNFVSSSQTFLSTGQRSGDSAITGSLELSASGHLTASGNISASGDIIGTTGSYHHIYLSQILGQPHPQISFDSTGGPGFTLGFAGDNGLYVKGSTGASYQAFGLDSEVENFNIKGGGTIHMQYGNTTGSKHGGGLWIDAQGGASTNGPATQLTTDGTGPRLLNTSFGGTGTHGTFKFINGGNVDNDVDSGSFTVAEFGPTSSAHFSFYVPTKVSSSLTVTGSVNITGSVDINIDSGTAFQINEPDVTGGSSYKGRLQFDFDDGDPHLRLNSRASTAATASISVLNGNSTTNGLHITTATGGGIIKSNNSNGIVISDAELSPFTDNNFSLGKWDRSFNEIYVRNNLVGNEIDAVDFNGGNRPDGLYNFGRINIAISSSNITNSSSHYFSVGEFITSSKEIPGLGRVPTVFKIGKSGSLSVNLNQGAKTAAPGGSSAYWYVTASAMAHVESDPNFNMDLFRGDKSYNDPRFKVDNEGNTTISGSVSASGLLYISSSQNSGQTYGVLVRDSTTRRVYHTGSYGTGGGSGDTVDLHFSASEGTGFSFANAATASFTSGSGTGLTVTAGSTNNIEFELVGVLSSSAQIASDISGAIDAATGSVLSDYNLLSSSYQIESDISGAIDAATGSMQTFLSTGQRSGDSTITGSLELSGSGHLTASGDISASGNLFALVANNTSTAFKTVMYDTATGKFYRTGSYGGGGGGGTTPSLQQVTTVGNETATGIYALGSSVTGNWGGISPTPIAKSGFYINSGFAKTYVTPQPIKDKYVITGIPMNPVTNHGIVSLLPFPNNYIVYGENGILVNINDGGHGGDPTDDHPDGKAILQYKGGSFEIVPSGSDDFTAHRGIQITTNNIAFFNNDASSSLSGSFFASSASAQIKFDTGSSAIRFLAGSTTEDLKEVLFISKSGDNPRIGVGTSTPKGVFDFKETLDSTTGTELLLRTSRTTQGGQTGDEGGSINFIIDSSSFNNIKTSGSLVKIKTIATTVGTTGVQGKLVLELSKGAISKVDAFEYGYSIGGITGFAQVQTASLVIKDFSEGQESELQMRDFTDNLRFHVFDGGVTMSGSLGVTGSALFNSHITASGNISSSGTIYADSYQVEGNPAIAYTSDTIRFGFTNNTPISIGKLGNPIQLVGTLTASDVTLDRIIYNTASSALGSNGAIGDIVKFGNSTTIAGGLYYLKNDGTWDRADADAVGTSTGSLAIAVATNSSGGMCLRGFVNPYTDPGAGTGNPVYLSTTYGRLQAAAPTGTGDVVRIVGYQYGTDLIYFNPSNDYIIHA